MENNGLQVLNGWLLNKGASVATLEAVLRALSAIPIVAHAWTAASLSKTLTQLLANREEETLKTLAAALLGKWRQVKVRVVMIRAGTVI